MNQRLRNLKAQLKEHQLDGLFVSHQPNIRYLTGFPAEDSWLLVTREKAFYITDSRYTLQARQGIKGIPVVEYRQSFFTSLFSWRRSTACAA
jgi:Xaa-Pro aminopeptidase